MSALVTGAASCTFTTATAGATLTPASVPCTSGTASTTLFVPENSGKKSEKVHVALAALGSGRTKSTSVTVVVYPHAGGRGLPGAPASVVATPSIGSASVNVTPPSTDGGEPIASYTVTAIDVTSAASGGQTSTGASSPLTVAGLVNGQTYQFVAAATNQIGTGPLSAASNQVIPDVVPGTPTGIAATPGDRRATVSFVPPGNATADTTYAVHATDLSAPARGGQSASTTVSPGTVTGLTNGDSYAFTVQAVDSMGSGPASTDSNQVVPEAVPGPPTGVAAVPGDHQATVSFVAPANATADTTYAVVATDLTVGAHGGQTVSTASSSATVSGLIDGDVYDFTVQATNPVGSGPLSPASNQVTPDPAPGSATDVVASPGDQQATVSFVPPTNAVAGTTYDVVATDLSVAANGGQTETGQSPVLVTGLIDGDAYTFTVTAVLGSVSSTPSIASNAVVPTGGSQSPADQAVDAGEIAYLAALNVNPTLAQCNTSTGTSGMCGSTGYGTWFPVKGSATEYYAFGNPQPTFNPTTHALDHLSVQVVGATSDPSAVNGFVFRQATITLSPANGFLDTLWWSNYESFSKTGDYSNCNYNWELGYDSNAGSTSCIPIFFGPTDNLFGPVYTNDSVFVNGNGTVGSGPVFGDASYTPNVPSTVTTADPNCLFVDPTYGMSGSSASCSTANGDVALYDTTKSSYGHPVEAPPHSDAQLGIIAGQNGCLYSGPTQITLSTNASGEGQMTVVSPDTTESTVILNSQTATWDTNNIPTNYNNCPNNGTAPIPPNGVVFVQNANGTPVTGANPFDDLVANSVTSLTASPSSPTPGNPVTLTATVMSATNQIASGATMTFSQTTTTINNGPVSAPIIGCTAVGNWSTPIQVGTNWTSTATCSTSESSNGTGAFSAVYSGGTSVGTSRGNLGQTTTFSPGMTYGPMSQTNAGGCPSCYYGESSSPDAEGDAFVNGNLSGQLTIGTANNVIIDGNLTYADCSGRWVTGQSGVPQSFCPYSTGGTNDSLGLIANNYVEVNHPMASSGGTVLPSCGTSFGALCDPSNSGGGLTIDAAVLALVQSFVVNNFNVGSPEGPLDLYGSIQQFARGPVSATTANVPISGYQKHYTWDPLLSYLAPPSYLTPSTPSWSLDAAGPNADAGPGGTCPPLAGVYAGTDVNGSILDGPSVIQYCSAALGGLPGFPST